MKYEFTFAEIAEIFKAVSSLEEKVIEVKKAQNRYDEASAAFDGTIGTPQAGEMMNAYAARERVEKSYRVAAKKLVKVLGVNPKDGYEDRYIIDQSTSVYRMEGFLYAVQRYALNCVKYINY